MLFLFTVKFQTVAVVGFECQAFDVENILT